MRIVIIGEILEGGGRKVILRESIAPPCPPPVATGLSITHLGKSATSRRFSKLSTEKTQRRDSSQESVLKRAELMHCVGVQRLDGLRARFLGREF